MITGEMIGSKLIEIQNKLMTPCHQKLKIQGNMGVLKILIENGALATFMRSEHFASLNRYHKSTATISTVFSTLSPII